MIKNLNKNFTTKTESITNFDAALEPKNYYDFIVYYSKAEHYPSMVAPIDYSYFNKYKDFEKGCAIADYCGIGYTTYGFYACPRAASLDRIFGFNIGIKKYPSKEELNLQKRILCRLCSGFIIFNDNISIKQNISPTWVRALKSFNKDKPVLTKI